MQNHDYCEICENILNEYEGNICCWCEKRSTDEDIEENCECGISETTGKWSDDAFDEDGCNCR